MEFTNSNASPLLDTALVDARLERWVEAQKNNKSTVTLFDAPAADVLRDLERTRTISRELQSKLGEVERTVRIADLENSAMNPTAKVPEYVENHQYVAANRLADVYSEEDQQDGVEEEKQAITKGKAGRTEIQRFYAGKCVLLTGGTGFLGKVIIEKLLRSCPDVDTIYLLVRSKKGKDGTNRVHQMFDNVLFERVQKEQPKCLHKVIAIGGDLCLPGLGLSPSDRHLLTNKVSIIINAAATVKFDEALSMATAINVRGTREIISLAKECRGLEALTQISTAFANCPHKYIEERFYEPPMSVEALDCVSTIDETILNDITPKLLGVQPNTYCFTKAVAEDAVRKYGEGMPICVVRPAVVISTYEEPLRGWTDNLYGPTGVMVGIGTGVLRTMYMDQSKTAELVPVDYTVNAILAATWDTAKRFKENLTSDIPIYNYVSSPQNPITWGRFIDINQKNGVDKPTMKAVWYYGMNMTKNYYLFRFYNFFLHFLPALLVDVYFTLIGKPRMMINLYRKVFKFSDVLSYFSVKEWKFSNSGVQGLWGRLSGTDQTLFPFNIAEMSWEYHSETLLLGLRVYLVKDDLSTLPEARKKWQRLYYMHQALKAITMALVINLSYWIFSGISRITLCN